MLFLWNCKPISDVRENVYNNSNEVKSHAFWIFEKRKKRRCSFRSHLITPVFNTQLPKVSIGKSPTSNIFAQKCGRIVHIHKQLCNLELCVINVYTWLTSSNTLDWQITEMNCGDHWAKYRKSFRRTEDKTFANDFLWLFDTSFRKNVKSHVFLKSEKT